MIIFRCQRLIFEYSTSTNYLIDWICLHCLMYHINGRNSNIQYQTFYQMCIVVRLSRQHPMQPQLILTLNKEPFRKNLMFYWSERFGLFSHIITKPLPYMWIHYPMCLNPVKYITHHIHGTWVCKTEAVEKQINNYC